jgi:hypothetical protein
MCKRRFALLALVSVAGLAFAPAATADPVNAKNSLVFPASCDNGQSYQVSVNGGGPFTPGHIVGSTSMFIPEVFDLTFEFTPLGGTTESETETSAKSNPKGDVTCTIDFTQTIPEVGTFHFFGTVSGFFTPAS